MPNSKAPWLWVTLALAAAATLPAVASDWPPLTAEELALKDSPITPGAAAVLLLRDEENDDFRGTDTEFRRLKILTEEGKKYADWEIPFIKGWTQVDDIEARVVRANGEIRPFKGEVFEKVVTKKGDFKLLNKTIALPDVEVGSIIDIRYTIRIDGDIQRIRPLFGGFPPTWIVQAEVPTLKASFSLRPLPSFTVAWTTNGIDANSLQQEKKDQFIRLNLENIPAFVEEERSPPEDYLKMRVDFFYLTKSYKTSTEFWEDQGKEWHRSAEKFIGHRKKIEREAQTLVSQSDSPEQKLRKIYERVQQIRNLSWEEAKTAAESKREKLKDNNNIEDILEHGYGHRRQINRLFVGLARAAGLEAGIARVAERDDVFFRPNLLDPEQLNYELAVVKLDGEDRFFDPGTPFCPFGSVYWPSTGVSGIRLNEKGGEFVTTPDTVAESAAITRKAVLEIDDDGKLSGRIEVLFEGQEALTRKLSNIDSDETGRRKDIKEEIENWLPSGAVFNLDEVTGWESAGVPLRATGTVEIADFGVSTGRRLIVPLDLFSVRSPHPFPSSIRVHPVYYRYPYQHTDDVEIKIPEGLSVESLPKPDQADAAVGVYSCSIQTSEDVLHWRRVLSLRGVLYPVSYYSQLRLFFDMVRTGDQQQAVLAGESP